MSLILEALKKSEAERQLGRVPGLATPMPVARRRRHGAWWPASGAALSLGVLLGTALWWFGMREASAPATAGPAASDTNPSPQTVPPPIQTLEPASPAESIAPAPPAPAAPEFDSVERESQAVAAVPAPPGARPVSAPAAASLDSSRPTPRRVASPPTMPPATVVVAPTPSDPRARDSRVAEAHAAPGAAAAPLPEALPRLDRLAGPRRDALPPLRQTMHVFAEQPAERFVLIDGQRYREGDRLANELTLLEIRRDGCVIEFDGMRFLLPRP